MAPMAHLAESTSSLSRGFDRPFKGLATLGLCAAVALAPLPALAGNVGAANAEAEAEAQSEAAPLMLNFEHARRPLTLMEPAPAGAPAPAPAPMGPPPKGIGMLVGGSVLVGLVGLPFSVWGGLTIAAANAVDSASDGTGAESAGNTAGGIGRGVGIGLLVTGLLGLAGGATMIAFGAIRLGRYNEWKAGNGYARLSPYVGGTRQTATYGFQLDF